MAAYIRDIRKKTGLTQKAFAEYFGIPLSTLQKWEQREMTPPDYVVNLISRSIPAMDTSAQIISGRDDVIYYYDRNLKRVFDSMGNGITIHEDLENVNEQNLRLYISDLFDSFYEIRDRFDRDCRLDKQEHILWSE